MYVLASQHFSALRNNCTNVFLIHFPICLKRMSGMKMKTLSLCRPPLCLLFTLYLPFHISVAAALVGFIIILMNNIKPVFFLCFFLLQCCCDSSTYICFDICHLPFWCPSRHLISIVVIFSGSSLLRCSLWSLSLNLLILFPVPMCCISLPYCPPLISTPYLVSLSVQYGPDTRGRSGSGRRSGSQWLPWRPQE